MNSQPTPQKSEGIIFTEIIPEFLKEVNSKKLVELGTIVRKKSRTQVYEPLTDSLRKIQWVKLVGLKAIAVERYISSGMEPGAIAFDPLGQTVYSLCVTDVLIHAKSALDSIAVFLNDLLNMNMKGGDRDFKKPRFRRLVAERDPFLKHRMKKLESWFKQLQEIRDEWIHRSSIRCPLIIGPSTVGVLPIPKHVDLDFEKKGKLTITKDYFWSTKDFVEYHHSNLLSLFLSVVDRCIQIERRDFKETLAISADAEEELSVFFFQTTQPMTFQRAKMKAHKSLVDW